MKTLYIECRMGAAGDMLTAALLELVPDREAVLEKLNRLGLPGVKIEAVPCVKCGISGTHMIVTVDGEEEKSLDVHHHEDGEHHHQHEDSEHHHHEESGHEHHHHHHHTSLADVERRIDSMDLPDPVRSDIRNVYHLIAEAESHAHGAPVDQIHFHEVGTLDALMDVTAVCFLMHEIGADHVVISPVNVGSGQVRCAHGIMPVPAPATAYLLRDIPSYSGDISAELCTPTGAALLRYFEDEVGNQPLMRVKAVGYGMGQKDFEAANCVRAFLGETDEGSGDIITELRCNIDDMTGEEIAFVMDRLFALGARDVFTTAIGMKKNRPGVLLTAIVSEEHKDAVVRGIFRYTTTIGIRETVCSRSILNRKEETVTTQYGDVRLKVSEGYGTEKVKVEYNDLEKIAKEHGLPVAEVRAEVLRAYDSQKQR